MRQRRSTIITLTITLTVLFLGAPVIAPAQTPTSLTRNPTNVGGGQSSPRQVTLTGPASAGGRVVQLSSSNPTVATLPASVVTIAAGATTASFPVTTAPVAPQAAWAGTIGRCGVSLLQVIQGFFTPAAWAGSTGRCGGTGGPNQKTLTCQSGQYVVGLQARGGTYVDLVGIACAPIGANGKRGTIGAFKSAGPGGGTQSRDGFCPGSTAVTRIEGRSGVWYDRLSDGACRGRDLGTGRFDSPEQVGPLINVGGVLGGRPCAIPCPSGEALISVSVRYGSWIDSISGQCRP